MVAAAVRWPETRFTAVAGVALPIIQAPMAGAGGVELAAGAARGGALGSLPCAILSPEQLAEQVQDLRSRGIDAFNLNFFCHAMPDQADEARWLSLLEPYYREFGVSPGSAPAVVRLPFGDAMCEVVETVRPRVVSFHFGLPEERLLARASDAAGLVIGNATSVAEARWLEERGVGAIIAQGWEAGGHAGRFLPADPGTQTGLSALVPRIVDSVKVPVIAAGGISDGRGIVAALALGAEAVQIGTAYLHCPESIISEAHRTALTGERAERTRFTNLFTGGLARGISTRLVEELGPIREEAPPFPLAASALAPIRAAAEKAGAFDFAPMWAGQGAALGRALPAAELTQMLASEAVRTAQG